MKVMRLGRGSYDILVFLGAYCAHIDKKLSISPVFSELLLHYFITVNPYYYFINLFTVNINFTTMNHLTQVNTIHSNYTQ